MSRNFRSAFATINWLFIICLGAALCEGLWEHSAEAFVRVVVVVGIILVITFGLVAWILCVLEVFTGE